jgi:nuclear GTP-binding protein
MAVKASDPYSVLLKSNKLPMTLIQDGSDVPGLKQHQAKMTIETSSFADTFGPKSQRKRVKLGASSLTDLAEGTGNSFDDYKERLQNARLLSGAGELIEEAGEDTYDPENPLSTAVEPVFSKGQSKRIWNELYKVLDSSDVVLHVLGTSF